MIEVNVPDNGDDVIDKGDGVYLAELLLAADAVAYGKSRR